MATSFSPAAHGAASPDATQNHQLAYALFRLTLGLNIFFHGFIRIVVGRQNFCRLQTEKLFTNSLLPMWLVHSFLSILPFLEVLVGVLIILGLFDKRVGADRGRLVDDDFDFRHRDQAGFGRQLGRKRSTGCFTFFSFQTCTTIASLSTAYAQNAEHSTRAQQFPFASKAPLPCSKPDTATIHAIIHTAPFLPQLLADTTFRRHFFAREGLCGRIAGPRGNAPR